MRYNRFADRDTHAARHEFHICRNSIVDLYKGVAFYTIEADLHMLPGFYTEFLRSRGMQGDSCLTDPSSKQLSRVNRHTEIVQFVDRDRQQLLVLGTQNCFLADLGDAHWTSNLGDRDQLHTQALCVFISSAAVIQVAAPNDGPLTMHFGKPCIT